MTLLPTNPFQNATATNAPKSATQSSVRHSWSEGVARKTQSMPFEDVIALLPLPVIDVAANNPNSGDHAMPTQLLSAGDTRSVQFTPFGDVAMRLPVPETPTAANNPKDAAHATPCHPLSPGVVLVVQVMPSGELMNPRPFVWPTATSSDNDGDHARP